MTDHKNERHIYQKDDPALFEQVENLVFAGEDQIGLDGKPHAITRGDDDARGSYYVLTPRG